MSRQNLIWERFHCSWALQAFDKLAACVLHAAQIVRTMVEGPSKALDLIGDRVNGPAES